MTRSSRPGQVPSDAEDPAAVRRDDIRLDVLGSGGPPTDDDDPALALLFQWRADLATGSGADPLPQPTATKAPRLNGSRAPRAVSDLQPRRPVPNHPSRKPRRRRRGYTRRAFTTLTATLVAVAGLGGVTVAAADAGPGSPLWPVTRAVYGERASSRQAAIDAERAIERARDAAQHGRPGDARRHLEEAEREAERVRQPGEAERLRDEADEIRKKLPSGQPDGKPSTHPGHGSEPTPTPSPQDPPSSGEPTESPSEGNSESDQRDDEDDGDRNSRRSSRGEHGRTDPPGQTRGAA